MPRIYTSANDPLDFCALCFPKEAVAIEKYSNVGDGPDDRGNCFGYGDDHPDYEYEDYKCYDCGCSLRHTDN